MTSTPELQTGMIALELINPLIAPLKEQDTIQRALDWMAQFRIGQLPVVEDGKYLGIVTEDMLYDMPDNAGFIKDITPLYSAIYVSENKHFFDVIQVANNGSMQLVAVVGEEDGLFKGVITLKDTAMALARTYATQSEGAVIVLQMDYLDYSLAQISRLVEENDAKILSAYVEADESIQQRIRLTLKINTQDISRIVATFERFEYDIIAKFEEQPSEEWTKDRLDMLFKMFEL